MAQQDTSSFHFHLPKRVKTPKEFKYLFLYVVFALLINLPPGWSNFLTSTWEFAVNLFFAAGHFFHDLYLRLELLIQVWLTPV